MFLLLALLSAALAAALPRSAAEDRLWADLSARLADPAAFGAQVAKEAPTFYEGHLFPYVLPVLALGSRRDGRYEALHGRLCAALLAALEARDGAPIDAYPGLVWTFDTVPVLLALRLRDRQVGLPGAEAVLDWPDGQTGRPDADSGPVIAGLGMASTGFGLGAARVLGDAARFARLDAELVAFPQLLAPVRPLLAPQAEALGMRLDTDAYLTGLLLGDVAMLWGVSWEDWGVATR